MKITQKRIKTKNKKTEHYYQKYFKRNINPNLVFTNHSLNF